MKRSTLLLSLASLGLSAFFLDDLIEGVKLQADAALK
jgi:hypothetical protein